MRWLWSFVFVLAACSSAATDPSSGAAPSGDPSGEDQGDPADPSDPSTSVDAGSGGDTKDPDPPKPDDILGTLSGTCGVLAAELGAASPSFETNNLAFVSGESYDKASLSTGGQTLFDTPNAGGSSTESEVMSFEVLRHCDGAKLLKTETQIAYAPPDDSGPPSITDLLVEINGKKVGVSVTRAYRPSNISFPDADVKALLEKKLTGVNRSSQRVLPQDKWVKQILHVFAATKDAADAVARVLPQIDAALRADTIVLLTRTTGGGFVYCDPDPPLGSECP